MTASKTPVDKKFEMITFTGKILFSDLLLSPYFQEDDLILNNDWVSESSSHELFSFPLGYRCLADELDLFLVQHKKNITTYGAAFSARHIYFYSLKRKLFISNGKVSGFVNTIDIGLKQLAHHPCFTSLQKTTYCHEIFTKSELQLLVLLTQFPRIKNEEIALFFNIKVKTTYLYKNRLVRKLKDLTGSDERPNFVHILNDILRIQPKEGLSRLQFIVLPEEEFLNYQADLDHKNTKPLKAENRLCSEILTTRREKLMRLLYKLSQHESLLDKKTP